MYLLSTFENYRFVALLGQCERTEHSRRTEACDDGSAAGFSTADNGGEAAGTDKSDILVSFAKPFLAFLAVKLCVDRADIVYVLSPACVKRYLMHRSFLYGRFLRTKQLQPFANYALLAFGKCGFNVVYHQRHGLSSKEKTRQGLPGLVFQLMRVLSELSVVSGDSYLLGLHFRIGRRILHRIGNDYLDLVCTVAPHRVVSGNAY